MAGGPNQDPLVGSRRHGRVCVAAFMPPDGQDRYHAWRQLNIHRYGPVGEWEVGLGRAIGGKDFVAVWVPEEYAAQVAD
jgi:hypothetical protein